MPYGQKPYKRLNGIWYPYFEMTEKTDLKTGEFGEGTSLAEGMWNTLEKMEGRDGVDQERRKKQLAVLKNLPEDFDLLVKGFYILKPDDQLQGEIFEYLVRADNMRGNLQFVIDLLKGDGVDVLKKNGLQNLAAIIGDC